MAQHYPPRERHAVQDRMRLSGLEPLEYRPDAGSHRSTFLNIGERCNVAGSSIYKKAIVDGDFDKALGIAAKQANTCISSCRHAQQTIQGRLQRATSPSQLAIS